MLKVLSGREDERDSSSLCLLCITMNINSSTKENGRSLSYSAFNGLLSGVLSAHHFGVATKKTQKRLPMSVNSSYFIST